MAWKRIWKKHRGTDARAASVWVDRPELQELGRSDCKDGLWWFLVVLDHGENAGSAVSG